MNPYASTCLLKPYFPNAPANIRGKHRGTGFLIASRIILTAAHNIIDPVYGQATSIRVRIREEWLPFSEDSKPKPFWTPYEWEQLFSAGRLTREFNIYDYGFIRLPKNKRYGDSIGAFTMDPRLPIRVTTVNVAGFALNNEQLWNGSGQVLPSFSPNRAVIYNVNTSGGVSGGPIFYQKSGTQESFVIGIHTANYGKLKTKGIGVKINASIQKLITDFHLLLK